VKGMEFDVVFFHNIDKSNAKMELVKRYIYVGVSRAAFFLGITMNEENLEISRYFEKKKDWFKI
jgi:DNA helicase IV